MKQFLFIVALFTFVLILSGSTKAQENEGHVFVITNLERAFPENGSARELDSLAQVFMDNAYKNNPYIVSYKMVRHWWGHNSRDLIRIIEVKSWDDVPKAFDEVGNQIRKAVPDKADREAFGKAYSKYFTGKHSDEIYQEVVFR